MTVQTAPAAACLAEQPEVLLVDDDEVNLMLIALALRERGFRITEVQSGERALALLTGWVPDIIVLDAMMPGMDGFDTCRELRQRPGFENVPVLMLTGLDDDASITRAYEAGATDFFVKATQWSLLARRLNYLLRTSRTFFDLERHKSKLARAQDLARMGSFDWLRAGGLRLSPEALRVMDWGPREAVTLRMLLRMVKPEERRGFLRKLHEAMRHAGQLATDVTFLMPDGRARIVHVEAEPEFNELGQGAGYSGIVQDVTERRHAEDKIRQLANFDSLTGLPNRPQLLWRAEKAIEQARRMQHQMAILLIDLDRFKVINDTLGHGAGDELLMEVGRRLRSCVRHSDQLVDGAVEVVGTRSHRGLEAVGRLGGDEFVALLPEVGTHRDAERVAYRVLQALREPISVADQECFVTASIGLALYPQHGSTVIELLRSADIAMYSAKDTGRNASAFYSPMLTSRGREKLELESALHKALERHELVLHYQPKMDMRYGTMAGAEALMRWQRGGVMLPPADFLPLAEETNLIVPISEWAIGEAARQAKIWQRDFGFDEAIAVNLPARMFERSDLMEHIHRCVVAAGMPHRSLLLEITEESMMGKLQGVIPALHQLKDLGVEVSIDDFGTGYSSLAYLTKLPIAELKIDRSFVKDLGHTPQSLAVVQAIIALGKALNLRVVAEGVERLRQMEVLVDRGCHYMQGWLFSKALPPDQLQTWLEQTVFARQAEWQDGRGRPREQQATGTQGRAATPLQGMYPTDRPGSAGRRDDPLQG